MRMSEWNVPGPVVPSAAIPGRTYRLELTCDTCTGVTSSGSCVLLSSTEAYAVTAPVDDSTVTSMRPSSTFGNPQPGRLLCFCSPALRLYGTVARSWPASLNSLMFPLAELPDPSTNPRLVRNFVEVATC